MSWVTQPKEVQLMSHKQDRERAQSGVIFRDGTLWEKAKWYALHPTRAMRAATQKIVKAAVGEELAKKFNPEAPLEPAPYQCSKCGRTHRPGTKVYEEHRQYMKEG
jgi:hypothetical protein